MKDTPQKRIQEEKRYVAYLWDDLTLDRKKALLAEVAARLVKRKELEPTRQKKVMRVCPFVEVDDDMAAELEVILGLRLADEKLRLCALHKYETLVFFTRETHEQDWTKAYSRNWRATRTMKVWPRRARSKANPWKVTAVYEVQLLPFEWLEDIGQYRVQFQFGKGVTQTYYFLPDFRDSSMKQGWVRPLYVSLGKPVDRSSIKRRRSKVKPTVILTLEEKQFLRAYKATRETHWRIKVLMSIRERREDLTAMEAKRLVDSLTK